ncbi:hypothetical protein EYF80_025006 [Liparis tanakae]|uniref:Uncharacterized protein n=1 Tax=Liparis tanakae TaxID=230148 RepID=A0A4Z2HGS8_9TELE|nr:hypothetical protein EYF80_025006 [Liparis tanakae]
MGEGHPVNSSKPAPYGRRDTREGRRVHSKDIRQSSRPFQEHHSIYQLRLSFFQHCDPAVTVADSHRGSWCVFDVPHIQAFVVQWLRVLGAVAVIVPLHLGSGGHQSGIAVQTQVEFPAEDGDVVVKPLPNGQRLSFWSFPLIIAYSYLPPPAPTGLPSCHVASRDGV